MIQLRQIEHPDTDSESIIWLRANQIESLEARDLAVGGTAITMISGRTLTVADSIMAILAAMENA